MKTGDSPYSTPPPPQADSAVNRDSPLLARHLRELLHLLGEDPEREELLKTPQRAAKALRELTSGYGTDLGALLQGALFDAPSSEIILIKDIAVHSVCEHHLLPFFGKAHVAYLPDKKIIGLSKVPRLVQALSRRLQLQERLTVQIAEALNSALVPLGVAVVVEARHLCMEMRGAHAEHSSTVTSAMLGRFRDDPRTRQEFLSLIR